MPYDTGVRLLDWPFDRTVAPLVDGNVLTATSGGAYLDPHLVVLATLLTFWLIYIGIQIRDIVASVI